MTETITAYSEVLQFVDADTNIAYDVPIFSTSITTGVMVDMSASSS